MTTYEIFNTLKPEEGIEFFNTKKTDEEIYDILVKKGLTDSFDTFKTESEKFFTEKVSKMSTNEIIKQIEGAELTDDQLEMIAGGGKKVELDNGVLPTIAAGSALAACAIAGIAAALA